MKDKLVEELFRSKCDFDHKGVHYWERLGVIESSSDVFLIWKCSQCDKCIREEIEFLEVVDESFRMSEEQEKSRRIISHFITQVKDPSKLSKRKFYSILHEFFC